MILPRILTALVAIPFVLAVVWVGSLPFFLFVCAISIFSLWEFLTMAENGGYPNQFWPAMVGAVLILLALYFDGGVVGPVRKAPGPLFIFIFWCFLVFVREFARDDKGLSFLRIITTISGVVLFALFLGHFLLIRDLRAVAGEGVRPMGREITFLLLILVWCLDTGAWLVGRVIGHKSLAPRLSPKKTWEGAIGGTILACGAAWLFREAFLKEALGSTEVLILSFLVAVIAQVSDLAESLIKRSFGAKDSSQLLPGHGGMMDRFDSFMFAAPFYYYLLLGTGRFH